MHFEEPLFEGRDQENVCVSFHGSLDLESTSLHDFIPSSHPAPLDSLLQQMLEEANVNDNLPLYSRNAESITRGDLLYKYNAFIDLPHGSSMQIPIIDVPVCMASDVPMSVGANMQRLTLATDLDFSIKSTTGDIQSYISCSKVHTTAQSQSSLQDSPKECPGKVSFASSGSHSATQEVHTTAQSQSSLQDFAQECPGKRPHRRTN